MTVSVLTQAQARLPIDASHCCAAIRFLALDVAQSNGWRLRTHAPGHGRDDLFVKATPALALFAAAPGREDRGALGRRPRGDVNPLHAGEVLAKSHCSTAARAAPTRSR
jgi:hypothetical protein